MLYISPDYAGYATSSWKTYPPGYRCLPLAEQIERLAALFPGLGMADLAFAEQPLPEGAEGYFAIPRPETVARTYEEALDRVLALLTIAHDGRLCNDRDPGCVGPVAERVRFRNAHTLAMLGALSDRQAGRDVLIVPAQFGLRHRGRGGFKARTLFSPGEFDLDAYTVGVMLLTHHGRLQSHDDLWINCGGDDYYKPGTESRPDLVMAPHFSFYGPNVLHFGHFWLAEPNERFGAATGFAP